MTIHIRRASSRMQTQIPWLDSKHSFSFGEHYDPENTHHGLLLVSNDDVIRPGTGFSTHPHRDMEIVTWVLEGELEHTDSQGNKGVIYPGLAQRMSAGSGIWHSEINASSEKAVRLVQMWVIPDTPRVQPSYEQLDIRANVASGELVPIASGRRHHGAISIHQKEAVLWGARLPASKKIQLPDAPHVHLYVAKGAVELEEAGLLEEGDAARLTAAGPRSLVADPISGAEVLIWEMGHS